MGLSYVSAGSEAWSLQKMGCRQFWLGRATLTASWLLWVFHDFLGKYVLFDTPALEKDSYFCRLLVYSVVWHGWVERRFLSAGSRIIAKTALSFNRVMNMIQRILRSLTAKMLEVRYPWSAVRAMEILKHP